MAKLICEMVPSIQKVRMTNSGTEACMSAIRLARGFTRRDKIIKFDGCYHGHADSLLVKAGSGALTFGNPDSAGIPADFCPKHTIVLPYNDIEAVRAAFAANKNQVAAIIAEPVPGNAGLFLPKENYLQSLREATKANGALLIFDEVMTGFRLARGGAQERFKITPDLTCLGKIIGGGLPVGAFGGRADIMDMLAPLGPVYQAGTLSGNPIAMAAGIAALEELRDGGPYCRLEELGEQLEGGLRDAGKSANIPMQVVMRAAPCFAPISRANPSTILADAMKSDRARFAKFFHGMLENGVYLAPSQFEAGFISTAHTAADLEKTISSAAKVLRTL